jgi:hypothetical protein
MALFKLFNSLSGRPAFSPAARPVRWMFPASPGRGSALDHWSPPAFSSMRPLSKTGFGINHFEASKPPSSIRHPNVCLVEKPAETLRLASASL